MISLASVACGGDFFSEAGTWSTSVSACWWRAICGAKPSSGVLSHQQPSIASVGGRDNLGGFDAIKNVEHNERDGECRSESDEREREGHGVLTRSLFSGWWVDSDLTAFDG